MKAVLVFAFLVSIPVGKLLPLKLNFAEFEHFYQKNELAKPAE